MSMLSIVANKEIIAEKIKELDNINFRSSEQLCSYIISSCLKAQYKMMRNVLNKNMLKKRHYSKDTTSKELLDSLYQHLYTHKFAALSDEIFEVQDAIDIYTNGTKNTDKSNNALLLISEELIDTFHFILEYTVLLEEQYQLKLCTDNDNLSVDSLEYYFLGENDFSRRVIKMLEEEGSHIFSFLYNNYLNNNETLNLNSPASMMRINREILRRTNFKDWKVYPDDFYGAFKFTELFELNRKMYVSFFQMFQDSRSLEAVKNLIDSVDRDVKLDIESIGDVFKLVYGTYMGKLEENLRRQREDPRYTGQNEGKVVGFEV